QAPCVYEQTGFLNDVLVTVGIGDAAPAMLSKIDALHARAATDLELVLPGHGLHAIGVLEPRLGGHPTALSDVRAVGLAPHPGLGVAREVAVDVVVEIDVCAHAPPRAARAPRA